MLPHCLYEYIRSSCGASYLDGGGAGELEGVDGVAVERAQRHALPQRGECGEVELPRRFVEHAAAEPEHQLERRLLLDVVVDERAVVLQLHAGE